MNFPSLYRCNEEKDGVGSDINGGNPFRGSRVGFHDRVPLE
jgi:hypothetical protein